MNQGFIPPHGGYEGLHSYKESLIIFMATYYLAEKWVRIGSRTRDQMEQSARSGKQNILEGSLASATSKKTEIHLTNVARASIGELHEDYKDFLRLRRSARSAASPCGSAKPIRASMPASHSGAAPVIPTAAESERLETDANG